MSNALLPFIGWAFLPNVRALPKLSNNRLGSIQANIPQLVTGWIQTVYYAAVTRVGDPKPQPGSPRYVKHRRRILVSVIIAYLLYTIYEADYQLRRQGDFYQSLGVPHDVEDRGIKSKFRRLYAGLFFDRSPVL